MAALERTHTPNQAPQPPSGSQLPRCTACSALKQLGLKTPFRLLHGHTQRRRYARSHHTLRRPRGLHCVPQQPRQVNATINIPVLSSNSIPCAASQPRPALVGQSFAPALRPQKQPCLLRERRSIQRAQAAPLAEHHQPSERRHKNRLYLMQQVIIGMSRHLQAETAQGVETRLHRRCPTKSCIGRLAHIGHLALLTSRLPLVLGDADVLQNQECLARCRQATTYPDSAAFLHHEIARVC